MTFRVSGNLDNIKHTYGSDLVQTLIKKSKYISKNRKSLLPYLSTMFDKMYSLYNENNELQAVAFSSKHEKLLKITLILEVHPEKNDIVRLVREIMKTTHNRKMITVNISTSNMAINLKQLGFEPSEPSNVQVMKRNLTVPVVSPRVYNKLEFKNENNGNLDIRVIPRGQWVHKGFSGYHKNNVLGNEKHFYVAPTVNIAKRYARGRTTAFLRSYQFTREVRLLHMTPRTVNYLIRRVFRYENRKYLLFTFGQLPEQMKKTMYKKFNYNNLNLNHNNYNTNARIFKGVQFVGRRTSVHQVNKKVSERLCSFLKRQNLDGYYYTANGSFHDEIMLCDASGRLLKMNNPQEPVTFVKNFAERRVPKITMKTLKNLLQRTGVNSPKPYMETLAARKIQSAARSYLRTRRVSPSPRN
jgi:hypothetical protein